MDASAYGDRRARIVQTLHGEPGARAVGLTFVPADAIASLRWGQGRTPAVLSAACSTLDLDFVFVPSAEPWADEAMREAAACGTAPMWVVDGPLQRYARHIGWTEALALSVTDPEAFAAALDTHAIEAAADANRGLEFDPVAVVVADDLAGGSGPLISPDVGIDVVVPALARASAPAMHSDVPAVFHSDGDIRVFLDALARHGFAAVHAGGVAGELFERLFDAARTADLAVIGGVDGSALRAGPLAAMRAGVSASVIAEQGGLLIADDGGISSAEELAAYVTALSSARDRHPEA